MLPQLAIPGLNSIVLYFALPCLLYRDGATTPAGAPGRCALSSLSFAGAVVLLTGTK